MGGAVFGVSLNDSRCFISPEINWITLQHFGKVFFFYIFF